ncbi:MAG: hypothetical protein OXT71_21360 [Acidobacteriota bacterium]|nr:hypothetical protein [Acidobacteriota bacterium]
MKLTIALIALLTVLATNLASVAETVVFRKVDFYEDLSDKEEKYDARLALDPEARTIMIADEKHGADKKVYALIPYDNVKKIVYERSSHRRYKAGLLVTPWLLFSKGKKHWLTIEFEGVNDLPLGYVYVRLHKGNYRRVLSALSSGVGLEIEEIIED